MKLVSIREEGNVGFITVELAGVVVHFVYKLPTELFVLPALGHRNLPHIVIGDFNSHITTWCYTTTDNNREAVGHLAEANNLTLIHDVKLPKSFNSKHGKVDTIPTSCLL